jgi:hypothetical protein
MLIISRLERMRWWQDSLPEEKLYFNRCIINGGSAFRQNRVSTGECTNGMDNLFCRSWENRQAAAQAADLYASSAKSV